MDALDELIDREAVAGLLALASSAAVGRPIGLVDANGRLIAGRAAGSVERRTHPLVAEGRTVGAVVGDEAVLSELLALVARALELSLAGTSEHAARARVAQELAIGRRIQLSLLPRRFPAVDGWAFAAEYEPAREIGGDLYDAFPLRGRTDGIGILIADVTGKGIPAALLMADVRALLHAAADNASGPADALGRVNRILVAERATSLFVTAALLVVEVASGAFRYATAGHEPPLVARSSGTLEPLEATGPILGAFDDAGFEERSGQLHPGDALVLYTDGVTEARSETREFYGEARFFSSVLGACGRDAGRIVRAVVDDIGAFRGAAEPFDDLTLLVVERA